MVIFTIFLTVFMHLVLPVLFLLWLYKAKTGGKLYFFSIVLLNATYLGFMWLMGAGWAWVGVFWPYLFGLIFVIVLGLKIKQGLPDGWTSGKWQKTWLWPGINILLSGIFLLNIFGYFSARDYTGAPLALQFPLKDGTFYVLHGGANQLVNYHVVVKAQSYALDIVALNSLGLRAWGILPDDLEKYQVFGADIVAPCTGEVIATRDGLADQAPFTFDPENLAGNHVILFCDGHSILLAHMQNQSLLVRQGDMVAAGQLVGRVGNTGNTSEPHLHIHAIKGRFTDTETIAGTGEPVPITFDGKFLIRHDRVKN